MARLLETPPFLGTKDGIVIYKLRGKYYMRAKSSLTAKRVRKSPEFKKTMESAKLLAPASKIASGIYRQLKQKNHPYYRKLTGAAMKLLKAGLTEPDVISKLARRNKR